MHGPAHGAIGARTRKDPRDARHGSRPRRHPSGAGMTAQDHDIAALAARLGLRGFRYRAFPRPAPAAPAMRAAAAPAEPPLPPPEAAPAASFPLIAGALAAARGAPAAALPPAALPFPRAATC